MGVILEVSDLIKRFPISGSRLTVQAINGVSFSIKKGETLALVGESGSGKTTVGRCLLGLETPSDGTVSCLGQTLGRGMDIRSPELRGQIQMVFQEPSESLDPRLSIRTSIAEPLSPLNLDRKQIDDRCVEAIRRVRLPLDVLDALPSALSNGQQQRICIARALVTNPKLIVLDEPTSALDPTARAEIIDLLKQVQEETQISYLFISHDLSAVHYVADRIAVMYLGQIVETGPAMEVFSNPRHPYSIGLLSSLLLPHPEQDRSGQLTLEGEIPSPVRLPQACFLAGRCPFATDLCRTEIPDPAPVGTDHVARCHHLDQVAKSRTPSDAFEIFQDFAASVLADRPATAVTQTFAQS